MPVALRARQEGVCSPSSQFGRILRLQFDLVVRFDIASRPFSDDEALGGVGWNGTAQHGEIHYTSTTCGAGSCYPGNHARTVAVVPVTATNNWAAGEIVMIRIRRKTSGLETGQGNLAEDFHLSVAGISYPN